MAGTFYSLFSVAFVSTATVTVTHNLDRVQVAVLVRVGNEARNDLVESVVPSPADPRNVVVVTLASAQSGAVLVLDTDYIFANIPTPEVASRGGSTIHTNVAGEIAGVTEKVTPVAADLVIIEDSADANNKKRVQVGNLPGGGSGDVVGPSSAVDGNIVLFDGTTGKLIKDSGVRYRISCCYFGGKGDSLGTFLIANGKSTDADTSTKAKTRQPIGLTGTLTKLVYKTKEATSTTQMKVHINGSVEATVVLANINANFGGVETISVSVVAGDYVEIEYDDDDKPGECTMYFIMEPS